MLLKSSDKEKILEKAEKRAHHRGTCKGFVYGGAKMRMTAGLSL